MPNLARTRMPSTAKATTLAAALFSLITVTMGIAERPKDNHRVQFTQSERKYYDFRQPEIAREYWNRDVPARNSDSDQYYLGIKKGSPAWMCARLSLPGFSTFLAGLLIRFLYIGTLQNTKQSSAFLVLRMCIFISACITICAGTIVLMLPLVQDVFHESWWLGLGVLGVVLNAINQAINKGG